MTADDWKHRISAGELDKGMSVKLKFMPLEEVKLSWEFDALIEALKEQTARAAGFS